MNKEQRLRDMLQDAFQELDDNLKAGNQTNTIYWAGLVAILTIEFTSGILTDIAEDITTKELQKETTI